MAHNDSLQGIESVNDGQVAENKRVDKLNDKADSKTGDKTDDKADNKIHNKADGITDDKEVDKTDNKAVDKIDDKKDDKVDDKIDEADHQPIPEWEPFSVAMNTLVKLTEHGYNKEPVEVSKSLLEKVIGELDNLKSMFVELECSKKSLMEEYCEKIISHDPNFVTTLNSFMTTVYKCKLKFVFVRNLNDLVGL